MFPSSTNQDIGIDSWPCEVVTDDTLPSSASPAASKMAYRQQSR